MSIAASVTVSNSGDRPGTAVVQLYGRVRRAQVTRPVARLLGYVRVDLEPGQSARVEFRVPTTRIAFSDPDYRRVVHPGDLDLWFGNATTRAVEGGTKLSGPVHALREDSPRWTETTVS
jgi:hypothetical protein